MNRLRPFLRLLQRWRLVLLLLAVAIAVLLLTQYFFGQQTGKVAPLSAEDAAALEAMEQAAGSEDFTAHEAKALCFPFDPNTADSLTLLRLGLKPWQVHNNLQYRRHGGHWRSAADFSRLYGLSAADYRRLAPYIRIGITPEQMRREAARAQREQEQAEYRARHDSLMAHRQPKLAEGTTLDINTADTTLLKQIPGIGSYYARRIVAYRSSLGGFISPQQVCEVPGVPADIARWCTVSPKARSSVHRLSVNTADFRTLVHHPYLSYEQVKAIFDFRRKHGRLHAWRDLSLSPEFTPADTLRLAPYLTF